MTVPVKITKIGERSSAKTSCESEQPFAALQHTNRGNPLVATWRKEGFTCMCKTMVITRSSFPISLIEEPAGLGLSTLSRESGDGTQLRESQNVHAAVGPFLVHPSKSAA